MHIERYVVERTVHHKASLDNASNPRHRRRLVQDSQRRALSSSRTQHHIYSFMSFDKDESQRSELGVRMRH